MWDETLSSACPRTRRNVQPRPETAEGEPLVSVPGRFPPPVPLHRVSPPVRQSLPVQTPAQGPTQSRGRSQRSPSAGTGKPGHLGVTAAPTRGAALPCKSVSVGKRTAAALAPCAPAAAWTPRGSALRGAWPLRVLTLPTPEHTSPRRGRCTHVHTPCTHTMHTHTRVHTRNMLHTYGYTTHAHMCAHVNTCTQHAHTETQRHRHAHVMQTWPLVAKSFWLYQLKLMQGNRKRSPQ